MKAIHLMTNINHQTNNIHYVMTVSMHTIDILFNKQPIILFTNDQPWTNYVHISF